MNAKQELERLNWNLAGVWTAESLDRISRDPAYLPAATTSSLVTRIAAVLAVVPVMVISAWRRHS